MPRTHSKKQRTVSLVSPEPDRGIIAGQSVGRGAEAEDEGRRCAIGDHPACRPHPTTLAGSYHLEIAIGHARAPFLSHGGAKVVRRFRFTTRKEGVSAGISR